MLRKLSAASVDRFNLCPFAHQRSRGAGDGWLLTDSAMDCPSRMAARSVSAHSRANPGYSVQGITRSLRHHDPLRRRANLNMMNIQPRRIAAKLPKTKKSLHNAFVTLTGRSGG
jgi:hypothetical protein